MSRKLGQIIAVRENTWMIRIPNGLRSSNQTTQLQFKSIVKQAGIAERDSTTCAI